MIRIEKLPKISSKENCVICEITASGELAFKSAFLKKSSVYSDGINCVSSVLLDNSEAFLKNSSSTDNSDDIEMIVNWFGNKIGLPMAKTYRYINSNGMPEAIISMDVAQEPHSKFIPMCILRDDFADAVKSGQYKLEKWMSEYIQLLTHKAFPNDKSSFESIAEGPEEINLVINVGEKIISFLSKKEPVSPGVIENYYLMIFFDSLIGQVDRTMSNYGLIKGLNGYLFSPLFDNATLSKPYTKFNQTMINGFICDRFDVLCQLIKISSINKTAKLLIEQKHKILTQLYKLSKVFLSSEQSCQVFANICLGFEWIEGKIKNYEGDYY